MSRNGAGVYAKVPGSIALPNTTVQSAPYNTQNDDFTTALNDGLLLNGVKPMTADLDHGGFKAKNIAAATLTTDAAQLGQVQSGTSKHSAAVAGTVDAITTTMSPVTTGAYVLNEEFNWTSAGANTVVAPTITKDGRGVLTIVKGANVALLAGDTGPAGYECRGLYNGTNVVLTNPVNPVGNQSVTGNLAVSGNETVAGNKTVSGKTQSNGIVAVLEQTITFAASVTFDPSAGADAVVTLTGALAFGAIANQSTNVGARGQLRIIQDATGGRTITWDTTIVQSDGAAPLIGIQANEETVFYYWIKAASGAGSVILTRRTGYFLQQRAAQNTTSGTSITFSNIPAWAKRLTILMNQVSTSGSSIVLVRLGTAGGVISSGYNANGGHFIGGATSSVTAQTAGFPFDAAGNAADTIVGSMRIVNISGTLWIEDASTSISPNNRIGVSGGSVDPAAAVTTLTLTTVNGTDTFDAGSVGLLIEG